MVSCLTPFSRAFSNTSSARRHWPLLVRALIAALYDTRFGITPSAGISSASTASDAAHSPSRPSCVIFWLLALTRGSAGGLRVLRSSAALSDARCFLSFPLSSAHKIWSFRPLRFVPDFSIALSQESVSAKVTCAKPLAPPFDWSAVLCFCGMAMRVIFPHPPKTSTRSSRVTVPCSPLTNTVIQPSGFSVCSSPFLKGLAPSLLPSGSLCSELPSSCARRPGSTLRRSGTHTADALLLTQSPARPCGKQDAAGDSTNPDAWPKRNVAKREVRATKRVLEQTAAPALPCCVPRRGSTAIAAVGSLFHE
mmetsp:Transcript_37586/g.88930  ORF Transcript_37586/g.88930 Transcript_37586/m.88930 type:complete len:308 (-) Transcript_37586:22-945(-)